VISDDVVIICSSVLCVKVVNKSNNQSETQSIITPYYVATGVRSAKVQKYLQHLNIVAKENQVNKDVA
jgi:hypothetical protein